ncbi:MAG TPA: hypothetical protein VFU57_13385 [Candidatus Acidoferrales bacterium]|nr:hypothetical protein [Candidatus Acidoferrales bacterium]
MKRTLAAIFVACILIAVAFAYLHHRCVEAQRRQFDASSPLFANSPSAPAAPPTAAANHPAAPDLIHQLPAGAHAIAFSDLAALRKASFTNELSALAPSSSQDPAYRQFVRETGFDYSRDLDRAAVALWPGTSPTSLIALAQGRFDQSKIERYALRNGGRRVKIHGAEVYEVPGQNSRLVRFTFLDPAEIAIADGPAITEILGPATSRLDSQMSARASAVSSAPVYAIARSQNFAKDLNIDATKNSQLAALLRSIRSITAVGQPAGDNLNVSASADCDSSLHAVELSTTLQGLVWMGRAALSDPKVQQQIGPQWPALDALLKAADISHSAHFVRLRLQITPQMLRTAAAPANTTPRE